MTQSQLSTRFVLYSNILQGIHYLEKEKLGVLVGISHSTAGKYKKKAKELGLLPEVIGNMSDEEIISLFISDFQRDRSSYSQTGKKYEYICRQRVIGERCCPL